MILEEKFMGSDTFHALTIGGDKNVIAKVLAEIVNENKVVIAEGEVDVMNYQYDGKIFIDSEDLNDMVFKSLENNQGKKVIITLEVQE